jgi:hypothetical protein
MISTLFIGKWFAKLVSSSYALHDECAFVRDDAKGVSLASYTAITLKQENMPDAYILCKFASTYGNPSSLL